MSWHSLPEDALFQQLNTDMRGLQNEDAVHRLKQWGPNRLQSDSRDTVWQLIARQFSDFMILVLCSAAVLAGIAGEITDTVIILVIVLANAIIGFFQEYRAGKAMDALKNMAAPQARVVRDGQAQIIPAENLVPGDIVLLEAGQIVPADIRILQSWSMKISEAALTGESVPSDKQSEALTEPGLSLGDRSNMAYKSTLIVSGKGTGLVVGTGMRTEVGKIAGLLGQGSSASPLQIRMAEFGKKLTWAILLLCAGLFLVGWYQGENILNLLLTVISIAVAAIPEALPVVITVSLAMGARKMIRQAVLVRKLSAIEALGSVTCICTDKTGTLTQNKMVAEKYWIAQPELTESFALNLALNHEVEIQEKKTGDPTEIALVELAEKLGQNISRIQSQYPRIGEIPFDSHRKRMSTLHQMGEDGILMVKGAPESILPLLTEANEEAHRLCSEWAASGYRVLALAGRTCKLESSPTVEWESGLTLYGLAGLLDPPRPEIPEFIRECTGAGIRTLMITGDHPGTALAIAHKTGIIPKPDPVYCLTGAEMESLTTEALADRLKHIQVLARVSPEQKFQVVSALQENGDFVAMTGDGVNDAPALEKAHVGVAMGISGTEVTREAADLVLLDDNFSTIVKAIRHGRMIYNNLRKFIRYGLTCNSGELWALVLAPVAGLPIPLMPIHILWINLVTDGLPGIALSSEPADEDIMQRPPRPPGESIFADGLGIHVIWVGFLMGIISVATAAGALHLQLPHWQTMVFTVLCFSQMAHVMTIRAERTPFFRIPLLRNPILPAAVMLTFLLQLALIYLPFCNEWFYTQPLSLSELLLCMGMAALIGCGVELEKYLKNKHLPLSKT